MKEDGTNGWMKIEEEDGCNINKENKKRKMEQING